jgi:type I restriction enzyme S subunit
MQNKLDARHSLLRRYGVPDGWKSVSLGEIADVAGGGTPSRAEGRYWQGGNIPWATPTDLTALDRKYLATTAGRITAAGLMESAATKLPVGTVLYTSRATIGAKAIATVEVATNKGFASFVPRAVDGEFLYYLLDLVTPIIKRLGAGTTFDEVSKRDIRKVHCAIPSNPDEQAAIANVLDAVDAAIDRAREARNGAKELQRPLVQQFFYSALGVTAYADRPAQKLPVGWRLLPTCQPAPDRDP